MREGGREGETVFESRQCRLSLRIVRSLSDGPTHESCQSDGPAPRPGHPSLARAVTETIRGRRHSCSQRHSPLRVPGPAQRPEAAARQRRRNHQDRVQAFNVSESRTGAAAAKSAESGRQCESLTQRVWISCLSRRNRAPARAPGRADHHIDHVSSQLAAGRKIQKKEGNGSGPYLGCFSSLHVSRSQNVEACFFRAHSGLPRPRDPVDLRFCCAMAASLDEWQEPEDRVYAD